MKLFLKDCFKFSNSIMAVMFVTLYIGDFKKQRNLNRLVEELNNINSKWLLESPKDTEEYLKLLKEIMSEYGKKSWKARIKKYGGPKKARDVFDKARKAFSKNLSTLLYGKYRASSSSV